MLALSTNAAAIVYAEFKSLRAASTLPSAKFNAADFSKYPIASLDCFSRASAVVAP